MRDRSYPVPYNFGKVHKRRKHYLTDQQTEEIRQAYKNFTGDTTEKKFFEKYADKFGIHINTVRNCAKNRTFSV